MTHSEKRKNAGTVRVRVGECPQCGRAYDVVVERGAIVGPKRANVRCAGCGKITVTDDTIEPGSEVDDG